MHIAHSRALFTSGDMCNKTLSRLTVIYDKADKNRTVIKAENWTALLQTGRCVRVFAKRSVFRAHYLLNIAVYARVPVLNIWHARRTVWFRIIRAVCEFFTSIAKWTIAKVSAKRPFWVLASWRSFAVKMWNWDGVVSLRLGGIELSFERVNPVNF